MEVILSFFSFFIVLFFFSDSHLSKCVSFLFFYQLTFLIGDFSNFHQTTKWEINSKLQSFKHMLHFSFSEIDVLFLGNSRAIRFSCESDLLVRHVSRMTALFINIVYIWFLTVATKTLNLIRLYFDWQLTEFYINRFCQVTGHKPLTSIVLMFVCLNAI